MNIEPTGNPWVVDKNSEASVVISTDAMKIRVHGKFRQRERKLFVLLIHSAWDELRTNTRHTIEVEQIRDIFREVANVKSFDDWLWDYLKNLAEVKVIYESQKLKGLFRLLASIAVDDERKTITYQIPEDLKDVLLSPDRYARLRTHFIIGLRGKYSVALYQLLESKINLKSVNKLGYVDIALDELKNWMGLDGEYKHWSHFNNRVLIPAVNEINSNPISSTFTVQIKALRGKKRKFVAVRFFLKKTLERLGYEKNLQASKERQLDANLYKLVPQFEEYWVIEISNKHCPGWDHRYIERQFREKVWKDRKKPQNPKGAFIGYCKVIGENPNRKI